MSLKKMNCPMILHQNLLSALGLNGAAILTEKSRNEAFVEYKNKTSGIISDISFC